MHDIEEYLKSTTFIDFSDESVRDKADALARGLRAMVFSNREAHAQKEGAEGSQALHHVCLTRQSHRYQVYCGTSAHGLQ